MANQEKTDFQLAEGDTWATFTRRTDGPKLAFLEHLLRQRGIASRRQGASFHAEILQVPLSRLADAWALLNTPVGELTDVTGATGYESFIITLDDVPNDHIMFGNWAAQQAAFHQEDEDTDYSQWAGVLDSELVELPQVSEPLVFYNVESSNISALAYDPVAMRAYVRFKGGTYYRYEVMPVDVFQEWMSAESKGKYFAQKVKGNYTCEKLNGNEWTMTGPTG